MSETRMNTDGAGMSATAAAASDPAPTFIKPSLFMRREMKPVALEKFDGMRDNYPHWITLADYHFRTNEIHYPNDIDKINAIIYAMNEGEAKLWRTNYIVNQAPFIHSFDKFRTLLDSSFMSTNRPQKAQQALKHLKQGTNSAEELISRFRVILSEAGINKFMGMRQNPLTNKFDMDGEADGHGKWLMETFLDCLNKQLREKIQDERDLPVNVQQAMKAAVRIDNQWRDREEEKKNKNTEWTWRDRRAPRVNFRPRWSPPVSDPNAMDIDVLTVEE